MSRPSTILTRPLLHALLLTTFGCGVAYWLIGMPPLLGAEDAAIGFRYARNLADGFGIVFNPGGEHVEGFTSLSWLLISAAVYAGFGEAGLEPTLSIVSLALTVFAVAVVVRLLEHVSGRGAPFWTGVAWLAGQAGFWFWSGLSLMDVAPWAAGIAALVLLVHRRLSGAAALEDSAPPPLMVPEPEVVMRRVRCPGRVYADVLRGLLSSPRFIEEFEPVRIRRGDSEPLIAYARSDWVASAPPTVERLGRTYCTGDG